jgi:hypothetical protein
MNWQTFRDRPTAELGVSARAELAERFAARVERRPELGRLVGAAARDEAVHRWVHYKEAFSPALVRAVLDHLGVTSGHLVDPFAGVGTSLLVAAERGMTATGVEMLPWPAFVASVKASAGAVHPDRVLALARLVVADRRPIRGEFPDFPVRDWAFTAPVLAELTRLGVALAEQPSSPERDLCRLALLATVEEVSQATKDGVSLRRRVRGRRPGRWGTTWTRAQVRQRFAARVKTFVADLDEAPAPGRAKCIVGDARSLPAPLRRGESTLALFSPPYPNRYDYTANYQLELGFGFVSSRDDLRKLRRAQLRSHLECPWPEKRMVEIPALDEFLACLLSVRRTGDETGRVFRMVAGYFEDMAVVLEQVAEAVRPGGHVVIVVGNQVLGGQQLPTDLLLATLAEDRLGMSLKSIWVAREKGVAPQQRARFTCVPGSRESVILLEA